MDLLRPSCVRPSIARRAIVQAIALLLASSAAPILAATPADEAEALRCEAERRILEVDLRHALAQCRRQGAEAEARRRKFDEPGCAERARRAAETALAEAGCRPADGDASAEQIPGVATAPSERAYLTLPSGDREVVFARTDGLDVLEGDIVLGEIARRRGESTPAGLESIQGFSVDATARMWPAATIPYDIDPRTPALVRERILAAIDHWNASTLFRLRPRTAADQDVLLFYSQDSSCWAELGRQGGIQLAHIGAACQRGNAIHEIGHAVGLLHEHTRPDRDRFVTVYWENIDPAQRYNFELAAAAAAADARTAPLAYDVGSLMHYGSYAFSIDGDPTLVRRTGATFAENREALSTLDVAAVTGLALARAGSVPTGLALASSGRCLHGGRSQARPGAAARLRACDSRSQGRWYFYTDPRSGADLLVHARTRQCLSVPGASTAAGVQLRLMPCDGGAEQRLERIDLPGGAFELRSAASGFCIGTVDGSGIERRRVVQAPCTGAPGQRWRPS